MNNIKLEALDLFIMSVDAPFAGRRCFHLQKKNPENLSTVREIPTYLSTTKLPWTYSDPSKELSRQVRSRADLPSSAESILFSHPRTDST